MEVQLDAWKRSLRNGNRRVGWKIGINAVGAQQQLGITSPVVGFLTTATTLDDGGSCPIAAGGSYMVEAEVALRLGRDVAPDAAEETAFGAIEAIAPAMEIVDFSRSKDGIAEILGHNIFHAGVVFGRWLDPSLEFEPSALEPLLLRNGNVGRKSEPALAPRSYGSVLSVVAARLADCGERLRKGDRVISGSYNQPLPVSPGDSVRAEFGRLGRVAITFS